MIWCASVRAKPCGLLLRMRNGNWKPLPDIMLQITPASSSWLQLFCKLFWQSSKVDSPPVHLVSSNRISLSLLPAPNDWGLPTIAWKDKHNNNYFSHRFLLFTCCTFKSKLFTDNCCTIIVPRVITDRTPLAVEINLHPTFLWVGSINQSYSSRLAICIPGCNWYVIY